MSKKTQALKQKKEYKKPITFLFEIDCDDDFTVDGFTTYSKKITFENSIHNLIEIIDFIKNIKFEVSKNNQYKADFFKQQINSKEFYQSIMSLLLPEEHFEYKNHVSIGGNQTLSISKLNS